MYKSITLSDNLLCQVRVLGLFELADLPPEILGPYTYTILTMTGEMLTLEYDLRNPELKRNPPTLPENTMPEQGTQDWHNLKRWHIHQAAILHEKARVESYEKHCAFVAQYIVTHCLSPEDQARIVEPGDFERVYQVALVPQLSEEALSRELDSFFQSVLQWPASAEYLVFGELQSEV